MAIDLYDYNAAYFKDLRNQGSDINSEDIDRQFTDLVNYINETLRPAVNGIEAQVASGVEDSAGALFQNNGAEGTSWAYVNPLSAIRDGEIAWKKLANGTAGSILATTEGGIVDELTPTDANQILQIFDEGGTLKPSWRTLSLDSLVGRLITGDKIALKGIGLSNLQAGIVAPEIRAATVTSNEIANYAVTTAKLAPIALVFSEYPTTEFGRVLGYLPMDDAYLTADKQVGAIGRYSMVPGFRLAMRKLADGTLSSLCFVHNDNAGRSVDGIEISGNVVNKIANGAITWAKIYTAGGLGDARKLAYGSIIPATHIQAGTIDKNCFDDATKALFTAKGL